MTTADNEKREPPFSEEELAELWPFDEPWPFNDDDGVEDAEELDMLRSSERGEWRSVPNFPEYKKRLEENLRIARLAGKVGPVDYDKPYPWSKKNSQAPSLPLAGDGVSGDNSQQSDNT